MRAVVARTVRPNLLRREFSVSHIYQTDGVFRALTNQPVEVPWVEAFRKQQAQDHASQKISRAPELPVDRDLSPRKMSDSYHSVVGENADRGRCKPAD